MKSHFVEYGQVFLFPGTLHYSKNLKRPMYGATVLYELSLCSTIDKEKEIDTEKNHFI